MERFQFWMNNPSELIRLFIRQFPRILKIDIRLIQ